MDKEMGQNDEHCKDPEHCKALLDLLINNQVHGDEKASILTQISHCMPCFGRYQIDALIRQFLQKNACSCPKNLLDRIKSHISNEQ